MVSVPPTPSEQTSFSLALWRAIRSTCDILHVQDPDVASWMDRLNRLGFSRPRVILGHGTEEPDAYLHKFSYLQHLTPGYRDDLRTPSPREAARASVFPTSSTSSASALPPISPPKQSLEQPSAFHPLRSSSSASPLSSGTTERCDYLIQEFAQLRTQLAPNAILVIAGGREAETPELIALGKSPPRRLRSLL